MNTSVVSTTTPPSQSASASAQSYVFLQKHIYQTTGIVLDRTKEYLIDARLQPILKEMSLSSIDQVCSALVRDPTGTLNLMIIDAMTTNETLFFRDFATFEALRTHVLPEKLKKLNGRRLRIWSAASSTGQEAYSLAMILMEMGVGPSQVDILGTDISRNALAKARTGRYVQFEMNRGLPSAFLKYFDRTGLDWQIKSEVRQMVRFENMDLRNKSLIQKVDLLLCRNVLIYFDHQTKQQILHQFENNLGEDGLLVLGCAETLLNSSVKLQRRVVGQTAFYSK
jgi:chemotaxis protein methyltransferase CheR